MAKPRWATFSVADHRDIRALVPDVLMFDRLVFPYPADVAEKAHWIEQNWAQDVLDHCLLMMDQLAEAVSWGAKQRAEFATNKEQVEKIEQFMATPAKWGETLSPEEKLERDKLLTRRMVQERELEKHGDKYLIMPCYRSKVAFATDQQIDIRAAKQASREKALALLVGQKMRVPDDADPKRALKLAVDLVKKDDFQRAREDLRNWQEDVLRRDQSEADDARQFDELIASLNKYVSAQVETTRDQWFFFALKRAVGLASILAPAGLANSVVSTFEFVSGQKQGTAPGAAAAFHHVRRDVIEPSLKPD